MITIDVAVPIIGKTYDFSLDENILVETVAEEIVELIIQKEGYAAQETLGLFLFSEKDHQALNVKHSLRENGVDTGDRLLLV